MKSNFRKLLSFLLALAMILSMIPAVMAEGETTEVSASDAFVAAMAAGGSIKLTDSFELNAPATVPAGVTVTLDLNGKTISSTNELYFISNAGELTIVDSREGDKDGEIKVIPAAKDNAAVYALKNTGKLTINGGNFTASAMNKSVYTVYSQSPSTTINGGTFKVTFNNTATNIWGSAHAVLLAGDGSENAAATINGGTFIAESNNKNNTRCAPVFANGTDKILITINGGDFTGTRTAGRGGSALRYPDGSSGATVVINGGTFEATKAGDDRLLNNITGKLEVNGGTFKYDGTIFSKNEKLTVTGGTFVKLDNTKNDISSYLKETYIQNADGSVYKEVTTSAALVEALAAGGAIQLGADITLEATAAIPAGKKVILDLNGKTISSTNELYFISNAGELTIVDSREGDKDGEIKVIPAAKDNAAVYALKNTGKLTINGGNFTASAMNKSVYTVYSQSPSTTINGGTFKVTFNNTATNIWGSAHAVLLAGDGSENAAATINGGTFIAESNNKNNTRCAPVFANGTDKILITINGGDFTGTRTAGRGGSALRYPDGSSGATVVINGGTFEATKAGDDRLLNNITGKLEVNGGTFKYDGTIFSKNEKLTVTGGTFVKLDNTKNDISKYLSADYLQNTDGSVTPLPDQVVIGSTSYKTLAEALEKSASGDTVTLQTDVALTTELTVNEGVTLDLNGKTLETTAVFGYGQILDSQQAGLLKVAQDMVLFATNNGHLPIYDAAAGGYRMAEVKIQTKAAANTGVFYLRFDLINEAWEPLLPENEIGLLLRVSGYEQTYAAPQQWLTALYNDATGRGAIRVTFVGWDNLVHNLTVAVANTGRNVEISTQVQSNDALYPNAEGVYEIRTELGLQRMAQNATKGYTYKLMNDIDLGGKDWTPVSGFKGTFDGNGKTISNFTITETVGKNMGFFATTAKEDSNGRTVVRNLNLKDMQIIVDGTDDDVNENNTAKFVGGIVGENYGDIENCTTEVVVIDKRQLADLGKTYYGTLVGNNAERTVTNDDGSTTKVPYGSISGTNSLATTVNITEASNETRENTVPFQDPGTKVNSKMALFVSDSVDYTTKAAKTAVGIAGNCNKNAIDQTLLWQDLSNSTDLAPQALQDRRETAAATMYEMCTVEWQPSTTMYNYYNYKSDGTWGEETKVFGTYSDRYGTYSLTQRGLPYAHSNNSLERFTALVGHYDGTLEQWDSNAYFYNNSAAISGISEIDGKQHELYDQTGWGLQIGADCIGQVAGAWRVVSATAKGLPGRVSLVGTADCYPSQKYMNWYGIVPVNGLQFEDPGDLNEDGTADTNADKYVYISNYYKNNKTHYLDALAMTSKADVLIGYSQAGNGHALMALSDAVVVRKWNGPVDAKLSYIVTAEQGGTGTDSDGINRYSGTYKKSGNLGTVERFSWRSTCCVDRRMTFADLARDGNGAGITGWQYFPITCDVLRDADSAAAIATVDMDASGLVSSSFHMVSITVNGETVYPDMVENLTGYRVGKVKVTLSEQYSNIEAGATVTVQLANGDTYTGVYGTAGLTKVN